MIAEICYCNREEWPTISPDFNYSHYWPNFTGSFGISIATDNYLWFIEMQRALTSSTFIFREFYIKLFAAILEPSAQSSELIMSPAVDQCFQTDIIQSSTEHPCNPGLPYNTTQQKLAIAIARRMINHRIDELRRLPLLLISGTLKITDLPEASTEQGVSLERTFFDGVAHCISAFIIECKRIDEEREQRLIISRARKNCFT